MTVDVAKLKASRDIVDVIGAYIPLRKRGAEFVGLCPAHPDKNPSFWVSPAKQIGHCFSCDFNADVIDFVMHMDGVDFQEACKRLGDDGGKNWKVRAAPIREIAPPRPERTTSKPPAGTPAPNMALRRGGEPVRTWEYKDTDGAMLGYVARYEIDGGKEFRCWSWGRRGDAAPQWECQHWNKPRPLYGLDRLSAKPAAPVLVVEGEKAADAAQALLTAYAVVSWPGGAKAVDRADWKPLHGRKVLLWPDNDAPGTEAMRKLEGELAAHCEGKTIDPEGMGEGFDAADWNGTPAELIAWAKPRAKPWRGTTPKESPPPEPPEHDFPPEAEPERPNGKNGSHIFDSVAEVEYRPMSEIRPRAISWLWPGRLAKGKVSMIVGNPGLGKSQVCASLASVVSNGGSWPVDRAPCERGSVVILSAEDDPEDTIRPRLDAAGANVERVFILEAIRVPGPMDDERRGFDLTKDVKRLGAMIHQLGDVSMVIIDPVTAYLGAADSHKNAEVRALLAPLAEMASNLRVAILCVSHLTKSSGMDALLRVQGSIGFAAAARAVWGVAKDKNNPARRLFMPLKNNLGTDVNGFAYSVESIQLQDSDISTSHVMWENELVTMSADEVFGQSEENAQERQTLADAKEFLRSALLDGPVATNELRKDADGAGHSWTTIRRAQVELKVDAFRDGFGKGGTWKWRLPPSPQEF